MDKYKQEVIAPGDRASALAHEVCVQSYGNCQAIHVVPHQHQSGNFRGPVGFVWKRNILAMMQYQVDGKGRLTDWTMLEEVENDGAGGKPQFFTLLGLPEVFRGLGWEIIAMNADDFARTGRFPSVMTNDLQIQRITEDNFHLVQALMQGYGVALQKTGLTNITGETAVMRHSITAFCDTKSAGQLVLTWGGTCIGLAHRELLIDGSRIEPKMAVVGFWEPGYRCNGGTFFTNLIFEKWGTDIPSLLLNPEVRDFVMKLIVPSQSYARAITRLVGWYPAGSAGKPLARIYGIAHITGGGVWGKFGEILPPGVGARLERMPKPADVLLQAQQLSWDTSLRLTDYQAYSAFHGGCGMLLVCHPDDANIIIAHAANNDVRASVVGITTKSADSEVLIHSRFKEGKLLSSSNPK